MQANYQDIANITDNFCRIHLNEEYLQLCQYAIAALCRKKPSPLLSGQNKTWAAAIIYALGTINFLFDKSKTPYIKSTEFAKEFNLSKSTIGNKAKQIRELLKIHHFNHHWMLPNLIEHNSMVWMITLNGFIIDARTLPLEIQEAAYKKGLIPYVYAYKSQNTE